MVFEEIAKQQQYLQEVVETFQPSALAADQCPSLPQDDSTSSASATGTDTHTALHTSGKTKEAQTDQTAKNNSNQKSGM